MVNIICQAHLLADPLTISLMYNLVLWNNFLKKKNERKKKESKKRKKCKMLPCKPNVDFRVCSLLE